MLQIIFLYFLDMPWSVLFWTWGDSNSESVVCIRIPVYIIPRVATFCRYTNQIFGYIPDNSRPALFISLRTPFYDFLILYFCRDVKGSLESSSSSGNFITTSSSLYDKNDGLQIQSGTLLTSTPISLIPMCCYIIISTPMK